MKKARLSLRLRAWSIHSMIRAVSHLRVLLRWLFYSVSMGALLGVVGVVFVWCISWCTDFRLAHNWMVLTLPIGGLLIVWLYHITGNDKDKGTNMVIASLRAETQLPMQMAPTIFLSTIITHFCGGSAGREGAALQLGGSLGSIVGRALHLHKRDQRVIILCGMAAAFSAIFRTPIAAAIFAMEVACVGMIDYAALVPCCVSSLTASWIAELLGSPTAGYEIQDFPSSLQPLYAGKVLLLGICCAVLSVFFCHILQYAGKQFGLIKNRYLRILCASGILLLLLLIVRNQDYIGLGSVQIGAAIGGSAVWYAFLLKILFTAVTIGGGFKGGEIVPSFYIGATFGCVFGSLMGISPAFCAGLGMLGMFCGVTNCPMATLLIGIELFGMQGLPYYLLIIAVSYLLSGYSSLYKTQKHISAWSSREEQNG